MLAFIVTEGDKITDLCLSEAFRDPKICLKCVCSRSSGPDPAEGAHDVPPDPRLGRGHPSPDPTALDAESASILAPSALATRRLLRWVSSPPHWFYQQIPSCLDPPLLTCGEYSAAHAAVNSVLTVCTCRQYTCTSHGGTVKLLMWLVVRRLASFMTLTAAFLAEHNKQTNAFITSSSYNKTAYSSGLAVASLTAVREVLGSNCAVGSCVYRKENLKALGTGYAHPSCMQCLGQLSLLPSVDEYQLSG